MRTRAAGLAFALLVAAATPLLLRAQDDRTRLEFWRANFNELTAAEDGRAAKAAAIFERVLAAAGRRAGLVPTLFVIKDAGAAVPLAIALPDGGIVISRQVLDICYKEPDKGDDRLAFILAHEIAHQLKDDFWHLRFFQAVELSQKGKPSDAAAVEEVRRIATSTDEPLAKELQADEHGIVYASMAGFDTRAVVFGDGQVDFFRYFAAALDPSNIKGGTPDADHPTPEARAAAVKARLVQVLDAIDLFDAGLLFYEAADYESAARLFEEFLRYYPGREVYHDLAACRHQIAVKAYEDWKKGQGVPFRLALTVGSETRARSIVLRDEPPEQRFRREIGRAVELYRTALAQDPSYWPAANNLGCALLLQDNAYEAVGVLKNALKAAPDSALVLSNLGAAYALAENPQKAKESLQSALKIAPDFGPALDNMGLLAASGSGPVATAQAAGPAGTAAAPAESLAGLAVGAYTDEIPAVWGAPLRQKAFSGGPKPLTISFYGNGVVAVAREDEIVLLAAAPAFTGKTGQGLGLGSAAGEVKAKCGDPGSVGSTTGGEAWRYSSRGLTFVVRNGRVVSWILSKPV
ncbi:MAG TPA: M48 family metalloprotease [Candidatus Bathyarchaeia archaeon]|nr:M48 family metalloprotease [Candidatus Bathyarchaeia archaeon]